MLSVGHLAWVMFPAEETNPLNRKMSRVQDKPAELFYKEPLYQVLDLPTFAHTTNRTENSIYKESNNLSQTPHHLICSFVTKVFCKKLLLVMNAK